MASCAAAGVATIPLAPRPAAATQYLWVNDAANNNFSQTDNWISGLGFAAPPNNGTADLVFNGTGGPYPNADAAYAIDSISFNGSQGYTFSGQALTIGAGGLTQNGTAAQGFGDDVSVGADQTWTFGPNNGGVSFNGPSGGVFLNGHTLTLTTATAGTINGNLGDTNAGGTLVKAGAGTVTINGSITATASLNLTLDAGTLAFSGATSAANFQSSGSQTVGGLTFGGTAELRSTDSVSLEAISLTFGGGTNTLSAAAGATQQVYASGTAVASNATVAFGTATATGTVDLQSPANLNGTPVAAAGVAYAVQVNGGTLLASGSGAVALLAGATGVTVAGGTTLNLDGNAATVNALAGSGQVVTGGATLTAAAGTFAGTVAGAGGLVKSTAGTLTLTGASTYAGGTTVSGGTLRVNNAAGSGTGTGSVTVNSGGTLGGTGTVGNGSNAIKVASAGRSRPGRRPGRSARWRPACSSGTGAGRTWPRWPARRRPTGWSCRG